MRTFSRSRFSRLLWPLGFSLLTMQAVAAEPKFTLTSPTVSADQMLPEAQVLQGFGCKGGNWSPGLQWQGVPAGTRSFALTLFDPDAPTGSGWWHWVVYNLPAQTRALPEGVGLQNAEQARRAGMPAQAVQGRTDFGKPGYGGACPPAGDPAHRYVFTLWALDTEALQLDEDASAALVNFMIRQHALGSTQLTARYKR